jgi:hypothetical protein
MIRSLASRDVLNYFLFNLISLLFAVYAKRFVCSVNLHT